MRISSSWIIYCCYFLILCFYTLTPTAKPPPYPPPTANLSTTWTINKTNFNYERVKTDEYILGRLILLRKTKLARFALGILCQYGHNYKTTSYFFAIFIYVANYEIPSPLVWSANQDYPVHNNAVLNFSAAGELVLRDADGSMVWATNTAGKSVVGMNLTDTGNLVLYDVNNQVVCQSFDHPTDCLLPGQNLYQGQKLISSLSSKNWTSQKGNYSLQVTDEGLIAYIESNPPQAYFSKLVYRTKTSKGKTYVKFLNGSLDLIINSTYTDVSLDITPALSVQYMKLMPDGHLRVFEWTNYAWSEVDDLLTFDSFGECRYPLACGRNALCTNRQQCVCPVSSSHRVEYFRPVNNQEPSLGCFEITPLTCNGTQDQDFIKLEHVKYFTSIADIKKVDIETCKQACLNNCSCKAALFEYDSDSLNGDCYLPSDLFTMMDVDPNIFYYNASAFVKVQNVRSPTSSTPQIPRSRGTTLVITSIAGSFLLLLVVVGLLYS